MQVPLARFVADGATVRLYGEFDLAAADVLRRAVAAAQPDPETGSIVLVLAGVTFLDSTGIATLLALRAEAATRGRRLVLRGAGPRLMRLLRLCAVPGDMAPAG